MEFDFPPKASRLLEINYIISLVLSYLGGPALVHYLTTQPFPNEPFLGKSKSVTCEL